jgi:hypothetical protein
MRQIQIELIMSHAEEYRIKALEFLELAHNVSEPTFRRELINMAMSYARLADLAEQNVRASVPYGAPSLGAGARH